MTLMRVRKNTIKRAKEIQAKMLRVYGKKIPLTRIIDYKMSEPFVIEDGQVRNLRRFRKKVNGK